MEKVAVTQNFKEGDCTIIRPYSRILSSSVNENKLLILMERFKSNSCVNAPVSVAISRQMNNVLKEINGEVGDHSRPIPAVEFGNRPSGDGERRSRND